MLKDIFRFRGGRCFCAGGRSLRSLVLTAIVVIAVACVSACVPGKNGGSGAPPPPPLPEAPVSSPGDAVEDPHGPTRSGKAPQPSEPSPAKLPEPPARPHAPPKVPEPLIGPKAPPPPFPRPDKQSESEQVPSQSGIASAERLTEYKTPAERLTIRSRNFPNAVVTVSLPKDYYDDEKKEYPLVIAFGGAGECIRPPTDGSLAWIHFYESHEAAAELHNQKLDSASFRGLATAEEIERFQNDLRSRPYEGIILACPYSPPLKITDELENLAYEAFVVEELIPLLRKRYRVAGDRVGVDGVSMGGARSIYYGFKYPEMFHGIGAIQGAFGPFMDVYRGLVKKNAEVLKNRPIQLVTSDRDPMAPSNRKLHRLLEKHGVDHTFLELTGPHDYIFNKGPGIISLLLFHNMVKPYR